MVSPVSKFKGKSTRGNSKPPLQQKFELDLVYDPEKLNETNLVSSNNITSRELSQRKTKKYIHVETGRTGTSNKARPILVNQTSVEPGVVVLKSPQFPQKIPRDMKKIETIPFELSKVPVKSVNSINNSASGTNMKTIKNFVMNLPQGHLKARKKRAKSRPVSRGSNYQRERGSANLPSEKQFQISQKQHRSFQRKGFTDSKQVNRKRALSSKEILLEMNSGREGILKGDLYQPKLQSEQVGLIYVERNSKVVCLYFRIIYAEIGNFIFEFFFIVRKKRLLGQFRITTNFRLLLRN